MVESFATLEDAVFGGRLSDAIRFVMDRGTPNQTFDDRNGGRMSVLHVCAVLDDEEVAKVATETMLGIGADPNIRDGTGETPLFYAVREENPSVVELLLRNGADPNAQDREGSTPLHMAITVHSMPLVSLLRRYGADLDVKNNMGISAKVYLGFEHVKGRI